MKLKLPTPLHLGVTQHVNIHYCECYWQTHIVSLLSIVCVLAPV